MPNKTSPPHPAERPRAQPPLRGLSSWLAVVRAYQKCSEVLSLAIKPLGLKLAQHEVLMMLLMTRHATQPVTQQRLAENSYVTKSHMSGVLTEMANLGWIARADSEHDKRSKVISLTPKGMAIAKRAYAAQAEVIGVMMQPLSDRQIDELERTSRNATLALLDMARRMA